MNLIQLKQSALEVEWIDGPQGATRAPLVFLHEGLGSVAMWRDWPARLCAATGCRGLVYSRPGYGRSTPKRPDEHWPFGFDLEQLEDVRLAVGEAAGLLAANAQPDTLIDVRLETEADAVLIAITGRCEGSVLPREDSFAWAVLAALVVDLWAEETPDGVTISLRSSRATAAVETS